MKTLLRLFLVALLTVASACQDSLDITNPNAPTFQSALTEEGILQLAMGGIYVTDTKYSGRTFLLVWVMGFHEVMGDALGVEAANYGANQIGCPDLVTLDDGTQVPNPMSPPTQKGFLRQVNLNQNGAGNPLYYEWASMYNINNSANLVLSSLPKIEMSGDAAEVAAKQGVLTAWARFWKGYAYSRIGSLYYAGIINNEPVKTNNVYVTKEAILAEAELNFAAAEAALNSLSSGGAYDQTLGQLIPSINQVGKGGILTPAMWIRNINTLRARNLLVNKTAAAMTPTDWSQLLTLTANGIQAGDKIFTIRSNPANDLMTTGGNVPAATWGPTAAGGLYKVGERLIQDFRPGDNRLANNFVQTTTWKGNGDRGNAFNTRWALRNGGAGMPGVAVMCNRAVGAYELYMAGFYEENELMKAEANIYLGNTDAGLAIIDNVRTVQGAGLAAVAGAGLTQAQAIAELRSERRVALAFRGLSFYDARRWEVINNGRTGAVVIDKNGVLNTNATIQYNYLDYWDVPDNELVFNPPGPGSADVKNPN